MASGFPAPSGESARGSGLVRRRARDERALYNPAFIATLVSVAAYDYERKRGAFLPWALAFVIPPLVLASDVRTELPGSIRAYLANWLAAHPAARADTPVRARALAPYTQDGIRFGLQHGLLGLADARLRGMLKPTATARQFEGEAGEIVMQAAFVGRWIAPEEPIQIFALLGMRP
jgi:Family of unknown function (DUF6521)